MFLLNSRTTFVTAPWNRIHTNTKPGIPYTEGTGLICRIPWARLILHILGFSPRGTCAGSGYGYFWFIIVSFSRSPDISQTDYKPAVLKFAHVLIIMILPWPIFINIPDTEWWPIQKSQKQSLRHRTYKNSSGILTTFPFPWLDYEIG